jgi:hypothetical protein
MLIRGLRVSQTQCQIDSSHSTNYRAQDLPKATWWPSSWKVHWGEASRLTRTALRNCLCAQPGDLHAFHAGNACRLERKGTRVTALDESVLGIRSRLEQPMAHLPHGIAGH